MKNALANPMPLTAAGVPDIDALLALHRATFGDATMTQPDPPADPPAPPAGERTPVKSEDGSVTYTQEALQAKLAHEKGQGKRAAERAIAEALGFDPENFDPAAVKAILDQQRAAEQANMTEAERLKAEAEADREQARKDREAADRLLLDSKKRTALIAAGVDPKTVDVAAPALAIGKDDDDAAVEAAIATLKEKAPGLFGVATPAPPRLPSGAPTGTPPRQQPTGDAFEKGAERAKKLAGASNAT